MRTHFLAGLADTLARVLPEEALTVWRELDSGFEAHSRLRRLLWEGVFGRQLRYHSADHLATLSPGWLPALAWVLASGPETAVGEGKRDASTPSTSHGTRPSRTSF